MVNITIIPREEFVRIWAIPLPKEERISLIADMCRLNALSSVKKAGSGHLGSTLSSLDIVTMLYYSEMNTASRNDDDPDRDIYFSSKGHDVPGYYAVLYSLGLLSKEKLLQLRRINGTCGHPDICTPYVEANSGSLGMGISKAKGMAFAKRYKKTKGRIFVMIGDGELQEGQNYEALLTTVHQKLTNITVIVDHNKVQTDKQVSDVCDLGDLEAKFRDFGWHVERCDGHNFTDLHYIFCSFDEISDKPKILIADTIKGKGISFMEHPIALNDGKGFYQWHSGAPDDRSYQCGFFEITERINKKLLQSGVETLKLEEIPPEEKQQGGVSNEYVAEAYGETLLEITQKRKDVIVLDADLAADCRVRNIELTLPQQFIENGIAEQDMVSMAGGLALQGLLPVVNSFAAFLASRANEQIYNNCCEKTKIVYTCHYAGLIPAGPGQSHQSIRDISLFGAIPNCEILQPCNALETRMIVDYCVNQAKENCMIRLVIGPSPRIIVLPNSYQLTYGCGVQLTTGEDGVLFSYGPVMLHESLVAQEILVKENIFIKVVNMPWLNRINIEWLKEIIQDSPLIVVVEDHSTTGGLGDFILNKIMENQVLEKKGFLKIGIDTLPAWGRPAEVLEYHKLSGKAIAQQIREKKLDFIKR